MADRCAPEDSRSTDTATSTTVVAETHRTTYAVSGMSCEHCRSTLTEAIGELAGVRHVEVDLANARVTVTGAVEPDDAAIAETVDDAGYELTGRSG